MSKSTANGQESTALEPPRHTPIGVDSAGARHHYAATDDRIYVIGVGGERELAVDVEETPLADWHEWIDHVRSTDGTEWASLTTAAVLAGAFGGRYTDRGSRLAGNQPLGDRP